VKAFETLIDASDAEYLAFCDQDDIWKPEKLQRCIQQLQQDGSLAVATDKSIIDKDDHIVCESVKNTSTKYYDTWNSGDDICKYDLFVCFAVGMSMVVNGAFARGCMPISKYTAHDKWLLACAATEGSVSYIDQPLVLYRRHGNNVSGTLQDVHSKKDYYVHRILRRKGLLDDFFLKYPNHKDKEEVMDFMDAQLKGDRKRLKKYSYLAPDIVRFDLVVSVIPSFLFPLFLSFVRKIA
ncbi:MAG: glycosyltransferase, partial [Erysipelotrichaceae bacterium]|nr:glycosyltransferase [Erysipelotrichaceae bacterium]